MTGKGVLRTIGLLGVVACAESTTSPLAEPQVATSVSLNVAGGAPVLDFSADLDKIAADVAPEFVNVEAADSLKVRIAAIKIQLAANDLAAVTATIAATRLELPIDASNAADLGYVELVFASIDAAIAATQP